MELWQWIIIGLLALQGICALVAAYVWIKFKLDMWMLDDMIKNYPKDWDIWK